VSGTLFTLGMLLLLDFPMPGHFQRARPAWIPKASAPSTPECRSSGRWTKPDSVLCTVRVRDSLERGRKHESFKVLLGDLESLAVHARGDSAHRAAEEALLAKLHVAYSETLAAKDDTATRRILAKIASLRSCLRELEKTEATRARQRLIWRRDSVYQAYQVALIDSTWAGYQDRGFSELLGSLGQDLLLLALLGLVIGAILDPINKWLFAGSERAKPTLQDLEELPDGDALAIWITGLLPKAVVRFPPEVDDLKALRGGEQLVNDLNQLSPDQKVKDWIRKLLQLLLPNKARSPLPDAPMFKYIGSGALKQADQDYLVAYYYRFAELTHALVLPSILLLAGLAHAISIHPVNGLWWLLVISVMLVLLLLVRLWFIWIVGVALLVIAVAIFFLCTRARLVGIAPYAFALGCSGIVACLLSDLSQRRHKTYRMRQWQLCYGASKAPLKPATP
jgi:hypothetical protein